MAQVDPQRDASSAGGHWFTTTQWSVVLAARADGGPAGRDALERLCRTYWYPLYAYIRRRGISPHDAQDLTQEFFARLLADNFLDDIDANKGKFRSFLLAALNHFLSKERDRASAAKRGGGKVVLSLDEEAAEGRYRVEPKSELSPEQIFERRWAVALLEQAMTRLREEVLVTGKAKLFEHLKHFLMIASDSGDYAAVAAELGMTASTVAVTVHRLRQRYRELVRAEIGHTVAEPKEIDDEMRHLLAVLAR